MKIDTIYNISSTFIGLITAGCIFRILYLVLATVFDPDNGKNNLKSARNAFIFIILANSIFQIVKLFSSYFAS